MKKQWTFLSVLTIILAVAALVLIVISMLSQSGNNIFLQLGLLLVCISMILLMLLQHSNRKKDK